MKAIVYRSYGPPDVVGLEEVATPTPADGEVLVKIHAAVVAPTDVAARAGDPRFARLFFGLTRPKLSILGNEFAGEIAAIGAGATRFRVGDQVIGGDQAFGAHAEYLCVAADGALAIKPGSLSFEESVAIVDGAMTALPFLRDEAKLRRGQKILINGASGAVGLAAVQLAKHFGAEVTAVCSSVNVDLVKSMGADVAIDYATADFTQSADTYDVIFDAVGKSSFSRCRRALTHGGIYLTTMPSPAILVQKVWTSKVGGKRAGIAFTGLRKSEEKAKDLVYLASLAETGVYKPVIDRCYPFESIAQAHRYVDTGRKKGSVVITVTN